MQIIPFCDSLLEAAGELTLKVWSNEIPEIPVPFRPRLYRYLVRYYYMPESALNFAAEEDGALCALLLAAPVQAVHATDADQWIMEQLKNEEEKQVFSVYKNYLDSNRAAEKKFARPDEAALLLFESVRKGAGRMLLQEFERGCRDRKIPGMLLWTDETCDFDYYNRNGFTAVADFQSVPLFGRQFRTWLFRKEF